MALRDISIRTPHKSGIAFNGGGAIWSVTSLYLSCLQKYNSGKVKKVVVVIDDKPCNDEIKHMLDVVSIRKEFDFSKYSSGNNYAKKKLVLDVIQDSLLTIAKFENWSITELVKAYHCCLDKNIEHKWLRKDKYFLSPDKRHYGGIFCNWDIDKFEAIAILFNKQKEEIRRVKLFESPSWDVDPMGKMGWDKETGEFYLYSKNELQKWTVKLI